jgi:hypothetical protein
LTFDKQPAALRCLPVCRTDRDNIGQSDRGLKAQTVALLPDKSQKNPDHF